MAKVTAVSSEEMAKYHRDVWQMFNSMSLEKIPLDALPRLDRTYGFDNSAVGIGSYSDVFPNEDFSDVLAGNPHPYWGCITQSPKSLYLPKTKSGFDYSPYYHSSFQTVSGMIKVDKKDKSSQFDSVASILFRLKDEFNKLEYYALSPDEADPKYPINLDKVAGLLAANEKTIAELERELVSSQNPVMQIKAQLDDIYKALGPNSSANFEQVTCALFELQQLLVDHLHECINLLNADQLVYLIAGQLRRFWTVHYRGLEAKTVFPSQVDMFFQNLFDLLNTFMRSSKGLSGRVSTEAMQLLLESLLPYLALDQNYILDTKAHTSHITKLVSCELFSFGSTFGNGFDQTKLTSAIIRLLDKYVRETLKKHDADLPPMDYPKLYGKVLGKLLMKSLAMSRYNFKGGDSQNSIDKVLVELNEPFELYSGMSLRSGTQLGPSSLGPY